MSKMQKRYKLTVEEFVEILNSMPKDVYVNLSMEENPPNYIELDMENKYIIIKNKVRD